MPFLERFEIQTTRVSKGSTAEGIYLELGLPGAGATLGSDHFQVYRRGRPDKNISQLWTREIRIQSPEMRFDRKAP